jgi:hypothetical protein
MRACLALGLLVWSSIASAADPWPRSPTLSDYADGTQGPYAPRGGTTVDSTRCAGGDSGTELVIEQTRATMPQHDVDLGRTKITLRKDGKSLVEATVSELWECLTYLPSTHRFVLTSTNEHGVKVTLRALVYLDVAQATFVDSVFDSLQFEASSSLLGPDGHYLALIGVRSKNQKERAALFALDLLHDKLALLGPAPAPPPFSKEELETVRMNAMHAMSKEAQESGDYVEMSYGWDAPERMYTEPDQKLFHFADPSTLEVSYGNDTYAKRSAKRRVRRFDLAAKR